jgi:branched-chain amino acid transport system permease protein
VLGAFIVLIVVAFPKGIVGTLEAIGRRFRTSPWISALLASRIETAE